MMGVMMVVMTRHQFFPACPPFVNTVYWFEIKFTIFGPKSRIRILEKPHIASLPFEDIVN